MHQSTPPADDESSARHSVRLPEGASVQDRSRVDRRSWMIWTLATALAVGFGVVAFILGARNATSHGRPSQFPETGIVLGAPESPELRWFVDETGTAPLSRYHASAADWCEAWIIDWTLPLARSTARQAAKQYARLGYSNELHQGLAYRGCLE